MGAETQLFTIISDNDSAMQAGCPRNGDQVSTR